MSDRMTHRIGLWLRGERAFGLSRVPAPATPMAGHPAPALPPASRSAAVRSKVPPAPRPATAAARIRSRPPDRPAAAGGPVAPPAPLVPLPIDEPFTAPPLSTEQKRLRLAEMDEKEVRSCTLCGLCEGRTHTVFGEGDPDAELFFIGEGPGESEDLSGRPFVGRAGQKLNEMIQAMGLKREQVYIANIVKCRPPGNRAPTPVETATCTPYLNRQLEIIRPKVIVTLGLPATQYLLQTRASMGSLRGQWHAWRGIKLMPTYHPAYILRYYTPQVRAMVWSDLQKVMQELALAAPSGPTRSRS